MMLKNRFLVFLALCVCMLWPATLSAQSSFKISADFDGKQIPDPRDLEAGPCGTLDITGGTGWLFIELTVDPYYHYYKRIHWSMPLAKEIMDFVNVSRSPHYLPDILIASSNVVEPNPAVEGQPLKYFWKGKLGRNLAPFQIKICRGAMGYWFNSLKFMQLAQVVGIEAHWVPGDKEPENPIGTRPSAAEPAGAEGQVWEAEDLDPVYSEGCSGLVQEMSGFGDSWSRNAQLFGIGPGGGSVTLPFSVDKTSAGELSIYMTKAPDFAIVEFILDGESVGVLLDAYAPRVESSGKISLGNHTLAQGIHKLTVKMVGRNPKMEGDAESGRLGIDYISFK